MHVVLSVEQAEAVRSSLRFSCSRLAKIAGSAKSEQQKREWAQERLDLLEDAITAIEVAQDEVPWSI